MRRVNVMMGLYYHGANVEASCSSVGVCAERIALANAVLAGKTPKQLAIVGEADGIRFPHVGLVVNSC